MNELPEVTIVCHIVMFKMSILLFLFSFLTHYIDIIVKFKNVCSVHILNSSNFLKIVHINAVHKVKTHQKCKFNF